MSTGVTQTQLKNLQRMTDSDFADVLVVMATVATLGQGFWVRFAATKAGGKFKAAMAIPFIQRLVADLFAAALSAGVVGALNSDTIKETILLEIFKSTGLQLDELSIEGGKRAAGQLLADKVNEKYGTTFTAFYPPENIVDQIRLEIEKEISEALV